MIAIYKTFNGEEFALISLKSIYNKMDKIIYLHSDISWTGKKGNTVEKVVKSFDDKENKIIHVRASTKNQKVQYNKANKMLKTLDYDYAMLIDTDEVWEEEQLDVAKEVMDKNPDTSIFKVSTKSYVKDVSYQIFPESPLKPMTFFRKGTIISGIRGLDSKGKVSGLPVYYHHYTAVRKDFDTVWAKYIEGCHSEHETLVDKDKYKETWDNIPEGKNLMPLVKHKHQWGRIKIVEPIPSVVNWNKTREETAESEKRMKSALEKITPEQKDYSENIHKKTQRANTLCISTAVVGKYQWYIPLFVEMIKKNQPEANIKIFLLGENELIEDPELWESVKKYIVVEDIKGLDLSGEVVASLRHVTFDKYLNSYDYTLITDVDIMFDNSSIVSMHRRAMRNDGNKYYDNAVIGTAMPGVHFVSKEWWSKTVKARAEVLKKLSNGCKKGDDEKYLAEIVSNSDIPSPKTGIKLSSIHGLHLGRYRNRNRYSQIITGGEIAKAILENPKLVNILDVCSIKLPELRDIFNFFQTKIKITIPESIS